jgi:ABC-type xylose transport system substrate-binding protein
LTRTDLSVANLRDAHLDGARLDHTILHGSDLTRASFRGAIFENADLRRALLAGVNLQDIFNVANGHLAEANFDGSCIDENTHLPQNAKTFYGNAAWCGPPSTPVDQIESPTIAAMIGSFSFFSTTSACGTIYYLIPTRIDEFQTESQKLIEVLFARMGCNVIAVDAKQDADLQVKQYLQAVRQKPDAIIANAVDFAKLAPAITRHKNDVLTLVYDRVLPNADVRFSVTANGYQTGTLAASKVLDLLQARYKKKMGTILEIVGDPADSHSTDFQKGFETIIAREKQRKRNAGLQPNADVESEIKLISKPAIDWDPGNALNIVKEIQDINQIDIIVAHAAHLLRPIVAFLKAKGESEGQNSRR